MKKLEEFLADDEEFFQLLIFQGRFNGIYAMLVPHVLSTKIRAVVSEGGDSALDYEVVIKAEELFTSERSPYPGATGSTIKEALEKLDKKFKGLDKETFFDLATAALAKLEGAYGA